MWSNLPSNLRPVLGAALLGSVGVAAAAFTLSFFALRSAASNPQLQFGKGHEWLFPIAIDMTLVVFEVLLIGASMVRVQEGEHIKQYPRTIPFVLVVIAAAGSLYFNVTRVPDLPGLRMIALAVPVASILLTLGLAYLLKMLATISGTDIAHVAPPPEVNRVTRKRDTLQGEIYRTDVPEMETSSGPRSNGNGHGRVQALAKNGYGAKRMKVQAYLDEHGIGESPRKVAAKLGVSARYVDQLQRERGKR